MTPRLHLDYFWWVAEFRTTTTVRMPGAQRTIWVDTRLKHGNRHGSESRMRKADRQQHQSPGYFSEAAHERNLNARLGKKQGSLATQFTHIYLPDTPSYFNLRNRKLRPTGLLMILLADYFLPNRPCVAVKELAPRRLWFQIRNAASGSIGPENIGALS
jgi:hypothetical protein